MSRKYDPHNNVDTENAKTPGNEKTPEGEDVKEEGRRGGGQQRQRRRKRRITPETGLAYRWYKQCGVAAEWLTQRWWGEEWSQRPRRRQNEGEWMTQRDKGGKDLTLK